MVVAEGVGRAGGPAARDASSDRRGCRDAWLSVLHRMWVDGSEFPLEEGQRRRSYGGLNQRRRTPKNFREISGSAPAEKCPHGDDGWGEFVASADPADDQRRKAPPD